MQIKLINSVFYSRKYFLKCVMRVFVILCCATVFSLTPKLGGAQESKISIEADKIVNVDDVFDIIKSETDFIFVYQEDLFKDYPKVRLKKGRIKVGELLKQSLSRGAVNISFINDNIIVIREDVPYSGQKPQNLIRTGTVKDASGIPIAGVTVLEKSSERGVITNFDGQYSIKVSGVSSTLVFSFLGFKTQEITVGDQSVINVSLKEQRDELGTVVINAGYYTTSRKEQTGSISRIDSKTIEKQPVSNPLSAMIGYMPGVNIVQRSGAPGGGFKIEIRGKNFINANTNPLYIVDGVPYSSESLTTPFTTGQAVLDVSPLNLIDPSSISSIEVLKDADATAIYGARGANGVVLITTKKGKAGKTQVKLNMTTSMSRVPHFVDLLNTEQYLEMRREAYANDGINLETASSSVRAKAIDLLEWDQERDVDWQEVLIGGTAYRKTAQISFSGGSAQTQFLVSGGYQNETTVYLGDSEYSKATVQSTINHQSQDNRFQINLSTSYAVDDNQLPGHPSSSLTKAAQSLPPNAPELYDEDGNLNWEGWPSDLPNPLGQLESKYLATSNTLLLNTTMSYRFNANLEFKANLGYTDYHNDTKKTVPHTIYDPGLGFTSLRRSSLYANTASRQSWIIEPQIHWEKEWGNLGIKFLVGTTFQSQESNQIAHSVGGFTSNKQILNVGAAKFIYGINDTESEYKYQSFFGRLNFKWQDQYVINLTGRRDGSSRFGPGKQFGEFGAIGVAWLFSESKFLKDNTILSFGKLRGSFGLTGSDSIGDYKFYDAYSVSDTDYGGSSLESVGLFNFDYQWEVNKKIEAALEFGFLQDRITFTTAWYRNRSSNQLVGIPLPGITGFSLVSGNFGAVVQNTGFEVDVRTVNIHKGAFKWITTFNFSAPRNKLVKFDGLESSTFSKFYVVGEPLSIKKLYHLTGVDPDTGVYQYEDYNGNGSINNGVQDQQWIEHTAPKFYGGLGNTLNYKNWGIALFFQFKKHSANKFLTGATQVPGRGLQNHVVSILEDRWQNPGDQATIQRYTTGTGVEGSQALNAYSNRYYLSDTAYADASFIRLRNVSLNYRLPKAKSLGMDINIYVQGHNLLTLTKFKGPDPDTDSVNNSFLPLLRKFTLGLQLGF